MGLLATVLQADSIRTTDSSLFGSASLANKHEFTGSVEITGSLSATSSWADNAISASWAPGSGTGSGGTVTMVSVTTSNGVSGTVANPSSTPAITITLGKILPSQVSSSFTGSLSGSVFGTASNAVSASWAPGGYVAPANIVSSSLQLDNGGGVAFTATDNVTFGQVTASFVSGSQITGSNLTVGVTSSLNYVTASNLNIAVSSSLGFATATVFSATSALKYKKNVRDLLEAVEVLNELRPVRFDWKDGRSYDDVGFIADEVVNVLPTLVTKNEKGEVEGLDYDKLTAVLAAALKDALNRIDNLEWRLDQLTGRDDL